MNGWFPPQSLTVMASNETTAGRRPSDWLGLHPQSLEFGAMPAREAPAERGIHQGVELQLSARPTRF
jgi:hypothetical protein